jgi:hypothetical protein
MSTDKKKQSKPRLRLSHDSNLAAALKRLSRDEVLNIDLPLSEVAHEACWFGVQVMRAIDAAAKSMDPPVASGSILWFAVQQAIIAKFGLEDSDALFDKAFRDFMHKRTHAKEIRECVEMNTPKHRGIPRPSMHRVPPLRGR